MAPLELLINIQLGAASVACRPQMCALERRAPVAVAVAGTQAKPPFKWPSFSTLPRC